MEIIRQTKGKRGDSMLKKVKAADIIRYMEREAPLCLAEEWDNPGLMIGSPEDEAEGVLLCLDVTDDIIEEAIKRGCNMIISHHPLIFRPLKNIRGDSGKGSLVMKVIRNYLTVYSAHTNLDYAVNGVNQCLAEALALKNLEPVNLLAKEPHGEGDKGYEYGLGRSGELENSMDIMDFCNYVKEKLNAGTVRLSGKRAERMVKKVGVFAGSFSEKYVDDFIKKGVDVVVTGDVEYNSAVDLLEAGIYLLDAGHYTTERVVLKKLREKLQNEFSNIRILCSQVEKDPFVYI